MRKPPCTYRGCTKPCDTPCDTAVGNLVTPGVGNLVTHLVTPPCDTACLRSGLPTNPSVSQANRMDKEIDLDESIANICCEGVHGIGFSFSEWALPEVQKRDRTALGKTTKLA